MSRFLLQAAGDGDSQKVTELLDAGADIEWRHKGTGRTALSEAAITGRLEVARILLDRGADANSRDKAVGLTPLGWAVECSQPALVRLLLSRGADPNLATAETRLTPLLIASQKGDVEVVALLLDKGAHVNAAAADGRTPLRQAQVGKHADVAKMLESAGGTAESPLPKVVVIPWPGVDATGAAIDYAEPEKVLRSFILAMNRWEREAAVLGQTPGGPATNETILASMQAVFGSFCTPAKRPYGRAGSYQIPPAYDPDDEVLIGSVLVKPGRAELTTRTSRVEAEHLYVLLKKGGRWLVDSKKRRLVGTSWSNAIL
jgi:uncharacterized protein